MSGKAEQPRASFLPSLFRVPLLPVLLVLLLAALLSKQWMLLAQLGL